MTRALSFFILLFIFISCNKEKDNKEKSLYDESHSSTEVSADSSAGEVTGLEIGDVAPNINLPDPDGKMISLYSLRGKVVLVDMWASWCGPCRRESPNVVKAYNRFKSKGFEIYGVSLDEDKEAWLSAIKDDGLSWIHVSDLGGWRSSVTPIYQVSAIPATYLLDKEGRIIAKNMREGELEVKLEEVFKEESEKPKVKS